MEFRILPKSRNLSLNAELVGRVHRDVADSGVPPGHQPLLDADYDAFVDELLANHPSSEDLSIFAYGSLIWKPACDVIPCAQARVRGWRRSFCLRLTRYRGTPEAPGLMMSLDRGGSCRGVLQRLPAEVARERFGILLRREMSVRPTGNRPLWVTAETATGPRRAIAFAVNHKSPNYRPERSIEETAEIVAHAVGHWGACADYLLQTVSHLEQLGIHDSYLWKLQHLVAERIAARD